MAIKTVVFFVLAVICFKLSIDNALSQETAQTFDNDYKENMAKMDVEKKHREAKWNNGKEAIKNDPKNIELLKKTANFGIVMGKLPESLDYYKRALKLISADNSYSIDDSVFLRKQIIAIYVRLNNVDMAVVEYKKLCLSKPEDMKLVYDFAEFLNAHGYPQRAFLEYKKIIDKNPGDLVVLDKIMQLYSQGYVTQEEVESYLNKKSKK